MEAARAFAEETMGARRADFEEHQKRRGVTRETWSVQETSDGNAFSVVWLESPDPEKAIAEIARDPSEFAAWFRADGRRKVMSVNEIGAQAIEAAAVGELRVRFRGALLRGSVA